MKNEDSPPPVQVVERISSTSSSSSTDNINVDIEHALDLAGNGKFQILHNSLMTLTLGAAIIEMTASAFVLPAAACDLDIPDQLKGLITSIPNIGIILTAPLWGRAADHFGRKPVLLTATAFAGVLGSFAAFMPSLLGYALFKLASSLFLSGPSSLGFPYAGELTPGRRRDTTLLMISSFLNLSTVLNPVFAWMILPFNWIVDLGAIDFRPWRLLTLACSAPLLLSACMMTLAKESPKFLMAKGRHDEALEVFKTIYSLNTGKDRRSYSVISLKKPNEDDQSSHTSKEILTHTQQSTSSWSLVKPPHLKWLALTGFLMFGIFTLLNGLFLFAPDTINKVLSESSDVKGTVCVLLTQPTNQTSPSSECNDNISTDVFKIMVVTTLIYSAVVLGASYLPLHKKYKLISMYLIVGCMSLLSGLVTMRLVAAMAMSGLQLTAIGVGALTAYAVDLFPTTLRGTAVGVILMFGRLGSIAGANISGSLLTIACSGMFIGFALLMFVCAMLCFLLPNAKPNT